MCKLNRKSGNKRIDPCIKMLIAQLNGNLIPHVKVVSCCCGHGKYAMSIIVNNGVNTWDLVSGVYIKRKTRFYLKDKQGYYYIPELN
jgi:hypothetical protein